MPDGSVRAAGGVLWRPASSGVEVALVHRPRYDDWSLPKGKLEPAEAAPAAAAREVCEETGFTVALGRRLGETRYPVQRDGAAVAKTVQWWAMRPTGGRFTPNSEVDELRWMVPDEALDLLDGRNDEPLRALLAAPASTRTLLLLRHGSAGDQETFQGDDRDRPLDERGAEQADAAARVLPAYAPERIVTAPLERCRATVRPLARLLGLAMEDDDAVSAAAWSRDPGGTLARLAQLATEQRCTLVCSQGEAIPGAVAELAGRSGVDVGHVRAPKGGLWALSLDDSGRVVDADPWPSLAP